MSLPTCPHCGVSGANLSAQVMPTGFMIDFFKADGSFLTTDKESSIPKPGAHGPVRCGNCHSIRHELKVSDEFRIVLKKDRDFRYERISNALDGNTSNEV